jgi:sugar phosphate isomerase/epimerase
MTQMKTNRRQFLSRLATASGGLGLAWAAGMGLPSSVRAEDKAKEPLYKISLAEYSLHRMIGAGKLSHLDFAAFTKKEFGIEAVEYWNRPFFEKAKDKEYIADMKQRAADAGVKNLLIMIDGEGNLGDPDEKARLAAVEKHYKWAEAAKSLDCHSIRVNAASKGTYEDQMKLAADGLGRLSEFAGGLGLNVIVENHGGNSSNGAWLAGVMKLVDRPNCGTLPDFGNFGDYDRYKGVTELMPFAKAVSAKSHEFDAQGNETRTDYHMMMKIVVDAGYRGYVGVEWEGGKPDEVEGVKLTQKLLERVRDKLSS